MKLLICTEAVDLDYPALGFFHAWIREFARNCETVTVITLGAGRFDLLGNVNVLSLGKEKLQVKSYKLQVFRRIFCVLKFYRYIIKERRNYDAVFVHMNPMYAILGGLLWKIWGKRIALWYTHKSTNSRVRLAEKIVDIVFTASKESFRVPSKKVKVMGHGIDTELFGMKPHAEQTEPIRLLSVSRIAPSKNIELMIETVRELNREKPGGYVLDIYGMPNTAEHEQYFEKLKKIVAEYGLAETVRLKGAVANTNMPAIYQKADLFLNFSDTGSMDKAILEAMSCGTPVLTTNEAFKDILHGIDKDLFCEKEEVVMAINNIINKKDKELLAEKLRGYVRANHGLESLIKKIISEYGF